MLGTLDPVNTSSTHLRPRTAFVFVLILLGLSGVGGCASGSERGGASLDPNARRLEDRASQAESRRDIFVQQGLQIGARTGVEVRTQLGTPETTAGRVVQNPRDPAVADSILTWGYPGVEVEIYRLADGRRLVSRMSVTNARHLRFPDLTIGTAQARIEPLIGAPATEIGTALEFRCGRCPESSAEPVFVTVDGGRVTRIDFTFLVAF